MKILLLALTFIYQVPLFDSSGKHHIGDLTVEEDSPDGSQVLRCKEIEAGADVVSCLVRYPDDIEVWLEFHIG